MPRVVTVAEAARRLGISRAAAWQAVRDGRLPSIVTVVKRAMVLESALRDYTVNRVKQRAGRAEPHAVAPRIGSPRRSARLRSSATT